MRTNSYALAVFVTLACGAAQAGEWSGSLALELTGFPQDALDPTLNSSDISLSIEPEYQSSWDDGRYSMRFVPFARLDQRDSERTHFDIRELGWIRAEDEWELRIGIRKVFWGVTETQHLVDIINQTDQVENLDGEDKLGQPMINLALKRDWGTVDLFVLPGFRERTFPGEDGRPRPTLRIDTDNAEYESSREKRHVDFAVRWSHYFGDWDLGLSHFYGTSRDPRFNLRFKGAEPVLVPYYDIINQTSIDAQVTKDRWLWKLEALHRSGQGEAFNALTGGFEYTFYGVGDSQADLGVILEYLYDDRDDDAPTPFQNDISTGVRLALNDEQSTEVLFGVVFDAESDAKSFNLEASRRLGDSWKLSLEGRAFSGQEMGDPSYDLRRDDYLRLELNRYF